MTYDVIAAGIPTYFDLTFFVQLILFGVFFYLLNVLFYQPASRIFRERSERIEAGVRAADESRRRAEETGREVQRQLDEARAEAQRLIAAAGRDAGARRQTLMTQAQQQADALIAQAQEEIRAERLAAVDQLRREAAALAILVASRVAGRSLDSMANRAVAEQAVAAESGV